MRSLPMLGLIAGMSGLPQPAPVARRGWRPPAPTGTSRCACGCGLIISANAQFKYGHSPKERPMDAEAENAGRVVNTEGTNNE
jgi:hypothetical protein